jgi:hypothetical protein
MAREEVLEVRATAGNDLLDSILKKIFSDSLYEFSKERGETSIWLIYTQQFRNESNIRNPRYLCRITQQSKDQFNGEN